MKVTSVFIRRHINRLPQGIIFSTRDLLHYGTRAAVDQCLYRLVKAQIIIRLAWGLFMRNEYDDTLLPLASTVAIEKAKAFGRQIISHGIDAAKKLGLTPADNQPLIFATNGRSSSFRFGKNKLVIYFKGVSARKMALGDSQVGLIIRALSQLGETICSPTIVSTAVSALRRPQRQQLRQSASLMPAWMTTRLLY